MQAFNTTKQYFLPEFGVSVVLEIRVTSMKVGDRRDAIVDQIVLGKAVDAVSPVQGRINDALTVEIGNDVSFTQRQFVSPLDIQWRVLFRLDRLRWPRVDICLPVAPDRRTCQVTIEIPQATEMTIFLTHIDRNGVIVGIIGVLGGVIDKPGVKRVWTSSLKKGLRQWIAQSWDNGLSGRSRQERQRHNRDEPTVKHLKLHSSC